MIRYLSIFLISSIAHAQIVFLDINNNPYEKKAAIEAAKQAGKEIIVYPKASELFNKEKAFEILKKNPPESLFISGHDGGGSFSGDRNESFGKSELEDLISEEPKIAENLRVLGLLGCNTANHSQILDWKQTFPNLSFVAGYDGTAPAGNKPAGWNYIKDTILKTDKILLETNEQKIKNIFSSFRDINYLAATLYVDTNKCSGVTDNPENQFIFRPLRKGEERFKKFDTSECLEKRNEYENKYAKLYNEYLDGNKEIPEVTSSGDLRDMYTFLRQNEHCFEDFNQNGNFPTSDHLLYMLFYHDVFDNFTNYYSRELVDFFDNLSIFSKAEDYKLKLNEKLQEKKINLARLNKYVSDYKAYEEDMKKYLNTKEIDFKNNHEPKYGMKYKQIMSLVRNGQNYEAGKIADKMAKDRGWRIYNSKRRQIDDLKKELKKGQDSEIYVELTDEAQYLSDQVTDLSLRLQGDLSQDNSVLNYKSLPAKSIEEFKKLDRKEANRFINIVNGLDLSLTEEAEFNDTFKYVMEETLYRLDEDVIPFNWHDSNLGEPIDPKDEEYTRENLTKEKTKVIDFESMYFSNGLD